MWHRSDVTATPSPRYTRPVAKKILKEPTPAKADPGDRARQEVSPVQAVELEAFAREAARLRRDTPHRKKKEAFLSVRKASGMTRETLLRWARLYDSLGDRLARHLQRHGKAKMYVLSYHPDPKQALRSGIPDPEKKGAVVRVADVNAEALRLLIRRAFPDRSRGQWFRLKSTAKGKRSVQAVKTTLQRMTDALNVDVERIQRLLRQAAKDEELRFVRLFRDGLRKLSSTITKALTVAETRVKKAKIDKGTRDTRR